MNVGELKKLLAKHPDDTRVVIAVAIGAPGIEEMIAATPEIVERMHAPTNPKILGPLMIYGEQGPLVASMTSPLPSQK